MRFIKRFFLFFLIFQISQVHAKPSQEIKEQFLFEGYLKNFKSKLLRHPINTTHMKPEVLHRYKEYKKKLDGKIPDQLLSSIIYWKIQNPSFKNLRDTLTFYFLIKLYAFRNYNNSITFPYFKNKIKKQYQKSKKGYLLALGLTSLKELTYFQPIKEVMENSAELLSLIDNHQKFISNLLRHPLIRQSKFPNLPIEKFVFLSPFGYTKNNKVSLSDDWEKNIASSIQFGGTSRHIFKRKFKFNTNLQTPIDNKSMVRPIYSEGFFPFGINDFLIDQITHARKKIFIESEVLNDPDLVETLIKEKIKRPKLQIKIILSPKSKGSLIGLPNNIYLKKMLRYKIKIRVKDPSNSFNNLILIDDKKVLLLRDSLNYRNVKNPKLFFGYQIISKPLAKKLTSYFKKEWSHPKKIFKMNIKDFETSSDKNSYSKRETRIISNMINKFLHIHNELKNRP